MNENPDFLQTRVSSRLAAWRSTGLVAFAGVAVTAVIFATLGLFTRPDARLVAATNDSAVESPFVSAEPEAATESTTEIQPCDVMQQTMQNINERMSEGVTEAQARYFRARRNKLYLMLRERCGG